MEESEGAEGVDVVVFGEGGEGDGGEGFDAFGFGDAGVGDDDLRLQAHVSRRWGREERRAHVELVDTVLALQLGNSLLRRLKVQRINLHHDDFRPLSSLQAFQGFARAGGVADGGDD